MQRNDSLDFLKFFAIFCVVSIHTRPFSSDSSYAINGEYIDLLINTFSRFAVPLFFLIAGYLIGQKKTSDKLTFAYQKKYLVKLTKILLVWTAFYFVYDIFLTIFKSYRDNKDAVEELFNQLSNISPSAVFYGLDIATGYQLWYLAALIWAALFLFLAIRFNKVGLLFLAALVLHTIGLFGQSYSVFLESPLLLETRDPFFFSLLYVTLGYWISQQHAGKEVRVSMPVIITSILFFSFLQIGENVMLIETYGAEIGGNYFIFTLPASVAILFLALKQPDLNVPLLNKIGANSVGIYVIHPFFISLIDQIISFLHMEEVQETLAWNLLYTPFIFVISYAGYSLLQRMKPK
ncbi:acyltransferase [Jeotgalibacillus sp. S-D1]|uniref:acyltransferase n=1 Tax=Jeotgalibacillus sp. S-D1 TaxID=2552189 RepID=UPI00105A9685|nr:acyltransferase [Jeotgalibacillus sp. S-D1]TDL32869.1 acyltransferase [Jeotgalibacillus sp. S-D1]